MGSVVGRAGVSRIYAVCRGSLLLWEQLLLTVLTNSWKRRKMKSKEIEFRIMWGPPECAKGTWCSENEFFCQRMRGRNPIRDVCLPHRRQYENHSIWPSHENPINIKYHFRLAAVVSSDRLRPPHLLHCYPTPPPVETLPSNSEYIDANSTIHTANLWNNLVFMKHQILHVLSAMVCKFDPIVTIAS